MIDKVFLTGRLIADPELRYTKTGKAVTSFRIAQSDSEKDANGEWVTKAQLFVPVTVWKNAESVATLTKGALVCVGGKLSTREWEERDGTKRSRIEMTAFDVYSGLKPVEGDRMQESLNQHQGPQTGPFAGNPNQQFDGGSSWNNTDDNPPF